jgi:pimeloyl-ACP methyl ester carboxylesterase
MTFKRTISSDFVSEITVRRDPSGGVLRTVAKEKGHISTNGETHLVLLIHGFAVNEEDARIAYKTFRENLPQDRRMKLTQFFWPGDAHVSSLRSKLGYSWIPDRAENTALLLEQFLVDRLAARGTGTINLYIVAHSLGCRVTLEVLRLLKSHRRHFRIRLVSLMAAAVPTFSVWPDTEPPGKYNLNGLGSDRVQVHYSRWDFILRFIFQTGQFASSSNPSNRIAGRKALGSVGLPRSYDHMHHITDNKTRNGHGGYWGDAQVAEQIAQYLPNRERKVRGRSPVKGRGILLPFTPARQVVLGG